MGMAYELDAIAAAVIGGSSLMGGVGRITGTLIGAVILGLIKSGFTFVGVDAYVQDIIKGMIILLVVAFLFHIALKHTRYGKYVYAIGGNMTSAKVSGINVNKYLIIVYTIAGALSGLAGVVLAARVSSSIGVGLLCGVINGVLITRTGIPPFIATLGMMVSARGLAQYYTQGNPISFLSDGFTSIGQGAMPVIILLQVAIIGIIAVGVTQVIITTGIDLSSGSVIALTAVVAASLAQTSESLSPMFPSLVNLPAAIPIGALPMNNVKATAPQATEQSSFFSNLRHKLPKDTGIFVVMLGIALIFEIAGWYVRDQSFLLNTNRLVLICRDLPPDQRTR
ncbi:hypothetical protein CRX72_21730 [Pantoea sp. BRM17]|nr:hypothetical protein CRX72_21730 [Pantoea sp. BRM17]